MHGNCDVCHLLLLLCGLGQKYQVQIEMNEYHRNVCLLHISVWCGGPGMQVNFMQLITITMGSKPFRLLGQYKLFDCMGVKCSNSLINQSNVKVMQVTLVKEWFKLNRASNIMLA